MTAGRDVRELSRFQPIRPGDCLVSRRQVFDVLDTEPGETRQGRPYLIVLYASCCCVIGCGARFEHLLTASQFARATGLRRQCDRHHYPAPRPQGGAETAPHARLLEPHP